MMLKVGETLVSRRSQEKYKVTQVRVDARGELLSYLITDSNGRCIAVYPADLPRWERV
ncbi:MAG TPA: hypothetical protein VIY48_14250 [Candidatus Paceibacterota bacterium]